MMPFNKSIQYIFSRLCHPRNLLFFVAILCYSCREEQKNITINWEKDKAVSVKFPATWANGIPKDSIGNYIRVVSLVQDTNRTPILGMYTLKEEIIFEPLIAFTRGIRYGVFARDKKLGEFSIPFADSTNAPRIIASYPQLDTVPENLLKIYIQFSHPMMESRSAAFIKLVKNGTDTLKDVFLDLQPELWNEDRTVITIWLDPGRIKRDLQPNLKLGAPLQAAAKYQLVVSKNWKDTEGRELENDHTWSFVTGARDSISPDAAKWKMILPKAVSKQPLIVETNETLDHFLLTESFRVTDKNGATVKGIFTTADKDRSTSFVPAEAWAAGNYTLMIASRLEDLAGNNLNRPFERDLNKTKQPSTQTYYRKNFVIEK